jgi:DNA-binding PadR family transcriptional regulator
MAGSLTEPFEVLGVEEGLLYPTLQKMLVKGWVTAEWGISETNRKGSLLPSYARRAQASEG